MDSQTDLKDAILTQKMSIRQVSISRPRPIVGPYTFVYKISWKLVFAKSTENLAMKRCHHVGCRKYSSLSSCAFIKGCHTQPNILTAEYNKQFVS